MIFSASLIWVLAKRDTTSCDRNISSCPITIEAISLVRFLSAAVSYSRMSAILYLIEAGSESVIWRLNFRSTVHPWYILSYQVKVCVLIS